MEAKIIANFKKNLISSRQIEELRSSMKNEYIARKVATKDMQPCLICSRPTVTVLYSASGPDWLYTCDIHLHDNPQFAIPIYSTEYQEEVKKLKALKLQADQISAAKGSKSWDGWVSHIFTKKPAKDESKEKAKSDTTTEEKEPEKELEKTKPEDAQKKYSQQLDLIASLQKKNKKYQLSDTTFNSRVERRKNQQRMAERRKKEQELYANTDPNELANQFNFPSVPKNTVS